MPTDKNNWFYNVWKWLISMKLSIILLIIIAGVSVFGTIIPQGEDPYFYSQSYGPLRGSIIVMFQLNNVFHSWWFMALSFFLTATVLACSINRLLPTWRQIVAIQHQYSEEFYTGSRIKGQAISPRIAEKTAEILSSRLRKRSYRVFEDQREDGYYIYADRGRFGSLGSLLVHLSLVLIVAGALYGRVEGYKSYANIAEGETYRVSEADFSLRLDSFRVDYYDGYMPKQYYSDLKVIDGGQEVLKKTISVNDPLTYKGVTFYQTSFGWVVDGLVSGDGKETRVSIQERQLAALGDGYSVKTVFLPDFAVDQTGHPGTKSPLPNNPRVIYMVYKGSSPVAYNLAKLNEPVQIGEGRTLSFTGYRQYTGLQYARDPGIPPVYTGLGLIVLGLFLNFYIIPRRIWLKVTGHPTGSRVLAAGQTPRFKARLEEEIGSLTAEAAKAR